MNQSNEPPDPLGSIDQNISDSSKLVTSIKRRLQSLDDDTRIQTSQPIISELASILGVIQKDAHGLHECAKARRLTQAAFEKDQIALHQAVQDKSRANESLKADRQSASAAKQSFITKQTELQSSISKLEAEALATSKSRAKLEDRLNTMDGEIRNWRGRINAAQQSKQTWDERANNLQSEVSSWQQKTRSLSTEWGQTTSTLVDNANRLGSTIGALDESVNSLSTKSREFDASKDDFIAKASTFTNQATALFEKTATADTQRKAYESAVVEWKTKTTEAQTAKKEYEAKQGQAESNAKTLLDQATSAAQTLIKLDALKGQLDGAISDYNIKSKSLDSFKSNWIEKQGKVNKLVDKWESRVLNVNAKFEVWGNRADKVNEWVNSLESYRNSAKEEEAKWKKMYEEAKEEKANWERERSSTEKATKALQDKLTDLANSPSILSSLSDLSTSLKSVDNERKAACEETSKMVKKYELLDQNSAKLNDALESNQKLDQEVKDKTTELDTLRKKLADVEGELEALKSSPAADALNTKTRELDDTSKLLETVKSEETRLQAELEREKEANVVAKAEITRLREENTRQNDEANRLANQIKEKDDLLAQLQPPVVDSFKTAELVLDIRSKPNERKRSRLDLSPTTMEDRDPTWADIVSNQNKIYSTLVPIQNLNYLAARYTIGNALSDSEEALKNFDEYVKLKPKYRKHFQCLFQLCHLGSRKADEFHGDNSFCKACSQCADHCVQVKEVDGSICFRLITFKGL